LTNEAATPTAEAQPQRKVTFAFKRKVNLENHGGGKYESAEYFMSVDDYIPQEATAEDIVAVGRELASECKALIMDEANVPWEVTEDGRVVELLRNAFGPGTNVQPAQQASQAAPAPSVPQGDPPPYVGEKLDFKTDKDKLAEQRVWAAERFAALDAAWASEFYDNRQSKKTPNHPDFRHKTFGISMYESDVKKAGGASLL
jgi:hypothetical protein